MPTTIDAAQVVSGTLAIARVPNTSGSYVGDSTDNKAVAHSLGAIPKLVMIQEDVGAGREWFIVTGHGLFFVTAGASFNWLAQITAPDATNFYVGDVAQYTNSANLLATTYYWIAIG